MSMRVDESRAALQALSRTALQARAKQLGVRANRKSIDIIEGIVRAQTHAGPSTAAPEEDDSKMCTRAGEGSARNEGGGLGGANTENFDPAALPSTSKDTPKAASPVTKCTPSPASTSPPPTAAWSALPNSTPGTFDNLPFSFATAPMHAGALVDLQATATATTPKLCAKAATQATAACAAAAPVCLPAAATTPKLSDLAAHASALALAAKLTNMRLDSELKSITAPAEAVPPSQLRAWGLPRVPEPSGGVAAAAASVVPAATPPPLPQQPGPAAEHEAVRRLAFGPASPQPAACGEPCSAMEVDDGSQRDLGTAAASAWGGNPAGSQAAAHSSPTAGPLPGGLRDGAAADAAASQPLLGESPGPWHATPGHGAPTPHSRQPAESSSPPASDALAPPPPSAAAKATAVHVTARTPLRQQRLLGVGLAPAPIRGSAAATPGARGLGGTGSAAPVLLPRTPAAAGLRTPARRVAVCTDEAGARSLDAWVLQHLLTPPGAAPGLGWGDLAGLDAVKQRLQAICGPMRPASGSSHLTGQRVTTDLPTAGSPASAQVSSPHQPPPAPRAATTASVAPRSRARATPVATRSTGAPLIRSSAAKPGDGTAARTAARSSIATTSTPTCRGMPPGDAAGQGRPDRAGHSSPPAAAASSPPGRSAAGGSPSSPPPPAAAAVAVLLCGPAGVGKGRLAVALAADLGASCIVVPVDLADCAAPYNGQADAVLRAVFRVASRIPGPVVVHLPDVEQLVGVEALEQGQEQRRMRTELMVAVDELLHQPRQRRSPTGPVRPASSPDASAGRAQVVVLSTSSRPAALDDALATCLGRTDRLLALLPDADAREELLVGQLAAEGADLGVEQVVRLARQTEGLSCAEIKAACDRAVVAAAARREARSAVLGSGRWSGVGSRIPGPQAAAGAAARAGSGALTTTLCEGDMVAAISAGTSTAPSEVDALERWHERLSSSHGGAAVPPSLQGAR